MSNPFHSSNAAAIPIEELRSRRVDRDGEISRSFDTLVCRSHNVLLYGARGVGKTFLVRLLEDEIQRKASSIFPCIINLASLPAYDTQDEVSAFPRAVLLQLCASLWKDILGKPYLDLRDRLTETGQELTFRSKDEMTIQRIHRALLLQQLSSKTSISNTAGLSLIAKGEKNEVASLEAKHAPLLPFEFEELVEQLVSDVLVPRGKTRVVVLCDEANHIKLYRQEQLLSRFFELFSAKRLQFLFVAGYGPWSSKEYIPACFDTAVHLTGFAEKAHVEDMVTRLLSSVVKPAVTFTPEALEVLFESFRGHPRLTLLSCSRAYDKAIDSTCVVDLRLILRVCRDVEEEERQYHDALHKYINRDA